MNQTSCSSSAAPGAAAAGADPWGQFQRRSVGNARRVADQRYQEQRRWWVHSSASSNTATAATHGRPAARQSGPGGGLRRLRLLPRIKQKRQQSQPQSAAALLAALAAQPGRGVRLTWLDAPALKPPAAPSNGPPWATGGQGAHSLSRCGPAAVAAATAWNRVASGATRPRHTAAPRKSSSARKLRPPAGRCVPAGAAPARAGGGSDPGSPSMTKGFELVQTPGGSWVLNPKMKRAPSATDVLLSPTASQLDSTAAATAGGLSACDGEADDASGGGGGGHHDAAARADAHGLSARSAARAMAIGVDMDAFPLLQLHQVPLLPDEVLHTAQAQLLASVAPPRAGAANGAGLGGDGDAAAAHDAAAAGALSPLELFALRQLACIGTELEGRRRRGERRMEAGAEAEAEVAGERGCQPLPPPRPPPRPPPAHAVAAVHGGRAAAPGRGLLRRLLE